ncbi:MAG TPA: hypothetical protein VIU64_20455 [Polyangia bacterium]
MASLRLVRPNERLVMEPLPIERALPRWLWIPGIVLATALVAVLLWWSSTADTRALRALPAEQRQAIYAKTMQILRETCDPAPPVSLRALCRTQAELASKLPECDADPACGELVRRHLFQPRR